MAPSDPAPRPLRQRHLPATGRSTASAAEPPTTLPAEPPVAQALPPAHPEPHPPRELRDVTARTLDLFEEREHCTSLPQRDALESDLVELNLGLADGIAARYADRGVEREDLVQVARLGLVKAVRRFHPDRGVAFSSFAIPTISGEVKRYFRDHGWMVRPPRRLQELHSRVSLTARDLEQRLHRTPTSAELAEALEIEPQELAQVREASSGFSAVSLDSGPGGPDSSGEGTFSLEAQLPVVDGDLERAEDRVALRRVVARLTTREQRVVQLRFGLDLTQAQIARELGVSQMQVSRILAQILVRLRTMLSGRGESTAA